VTVNHVKNMALIGGSAADTEEIYLASRVVGRWGSPGPHSRRWVTVWMTGR
jgi:hypothetical protein